MKILLLYYQVDQPVSRWFQIGQFICCIFPHSYLTVKDNKFFSIGMCLKSNKEYFVTYVYLILCSSSIRIGNYRTNLLYVIWEIDFINFFNYNYYCWWLRLKFRCLCIYYNSISLQLFATFSLFEFKSLLCNSLSMSFLCRTYRQALHSMSRM